MRRVLAVIAISLLLVGCNANTVRIADELVAFGVKQDEADAIASALIRQGKSDDEAIELAPFIGDFAGQQRSVDDVLLLSARAMELQASFGAAERRAVDNVVTTLRQQGRTSEFIRGEVQEIVKYTSCQVLEWTWIDGRWITREWFDGITREEVLAYAESYIASRVQDAVEERVRIFIGMSDADLVAWEVFAALDAAQGQNDLEVAFKQAVEDYCA